MTDLPRRPATAYPSILRSPGRLILATLGVLSVGLALLGVALPGLPTTVFLILASYLFTRSSPALGERLLRIRVFRPYLQYIDGKRAMPRRVRYGALLMMWTAVAVSLLVLSSRQVVGTWVFALILASAVAGTVMILLWRRGAAVPASRGSTDLT